MTKNPTMLAVYITVCMGFVGLSLPYPVFSHLFLLESSNLLPAGTSEQTRTLLLGLAMAIFPVGQAISSPILGKQSDRWGRRPMLLISLCLAAIGMLMVALSLVINSLLLLLAGRFISGLGEGNIALAQAIASDLSDEEQQSRNFAGISIAINIGWIIGPLLGGILGDPHLFSWTSPTLPFWVAAGLYLINLLVVAVTIRETRAVTTEHTKQAVSLSQLLTNWPAFSLLLGVTAISFFGVFIMFLYFGPYLVQVFTVSSTELGIYAALFSIPLIAAAWLATRLEKTIGPVNIQLYSLLLLAIGMIGFILPDSVLHLIWPVCIVSFGIVFTEVATAVLVVKTTPEHIRGQAMGIYRTVIVLAEIVASLLGGYLAGLIPALPFIIAAIIMLMAMPLLKLPLLKQSQ